MTAEEYIAAHNPCTEGRAYLLTQPSLAAAWDNCPRGAWLVWGLSKLPADRSPTAATLRKSACAIVRATCWDMLTDERSRRAVEVAERHADGLATDAELESSHADAFAAYGVAEDAENAYAAAYAAAYAVAADAADAYAALDAAYAAAHTAGAASERVADIIRSFIPNPCTT